MIRAWQPRLLGAELALCQRYYNKTFDVDQGPVQNLGISSNGLIIGYAQGANLSAMWYYGTKMRIAPTIVTYNPGNTNSSWRNSANNADVGAGTYGVGQASATLFATATAAAAVFWYIHASVDVDL